MKKILIAFTLTFVFLFKSFACLNGETLMLKDGTLLYEDRDDKVPRGHDYLHDRRSYKASIITLDSLFQVTKDVGYISDHGVLLILLNKYDEAIQLYLEVERKAPNRYSTAANIGTAYELAGQNENALKWIKRAVELDSNSHYGSEWIHVKILEAKIKGEEFYNTDFLLNTHFGSGAEPYSGIPKEKLTLLHQQLYYQLNERISFVKPKDQLVAQLLFDLGNAAYELGNYSDAKEDYELAQKYGFTSDLIDTRIDKSIASANDADKKARKKDGSLIGGILQFALPVMVIAFVFALLMLIVRYFMKR